MKNRTLSYVRAHRTRWALSAEELAHLLGRDASMVCRLEKCGQSPGGKIALGFKVIFGVCPQEMFPGLYEQVEEAVMARAAHLYERLDGKTDRKSVRKRELLTEMMKRATSNRVHL